MSSSILELAVGGSPFPHGREDGVWSYRHAVRPEGHSPLDAQMISDFLTYEASNDRKVSVVADPDLADWETWRTPDDRPAPADFAIQCCTHVYASGCTSELVCHGAPSAVASRILQDGVLRAASDAPGCDASVLADASSWGEPADFFDHVMFANGRCTAPEAVAFSRELGRDLVPTDLRPGYPPAVRFYFDWNELVVRDDARFDGVHPIKVERSLELQDTLVAVVVHSNQSDVVDIASASRFKDRVLFLDLDNPQPFEWATSANEAARAFRDGARH